jgi:rubrerythrin
LRANSQLGVSYNPEVMTLAQRTAKELSALDDLLSQEQCAVSKYEAYAAQVTDPQLRDLCTDVARRHREHYNTLLRHLR